MLISTIAKAGDTSFKKKRPPVSKTPVYWWNDGVEDVRKNCLKQRRKLMKTNTKKDVSQDEKEKYRTLKKTLKKEIQKAKAKARQKTCQALDNDLLRRSISTWRIPTVNRREVPLFNMEEL
mgnify:CR=1 FL=1